MLGFSPCSTWTFSMIIGRNLALVYKSTVPRLFSTARNAHAVPLLSFALGMIWGRPNIFVAEKFLHGPAAWSITVVHLPKYNRLKPVH